MRVIQLVPINVFHLADSGNTADMIKNYGAIGKHVWLRYKCFYYFFQEEMCKTYRSYMNKLAQKFILDVNKLLQHHILIVVKIDEVLLRLCEMVKPLVKNISLSVTCIKTRFKHYVSFLIHDRIQMWQYTFFKLRFFGNGFIFFLIGLFFMFH